MNSDYLIKVEIKATTDGIFPNDVKQITHADIQFYAPIDETKNKAFHKAKDNLLKAVKEMYSFEDEQQVDVSIKYIYDGVNNQWVIWHLT